MRNIGSMLALFASILSDFLGYRTFNAKPGHLGKPGWLDIPFLLISPIQGARAKVFAPRGYWHGGVAILMMPLSSPICY